MEKDKSYFVVYYDGHKYWTKTLIYKGCEDKLLHFWNDYLQENEWLHIDKIVRIKDSKEVKDADRYS